MNERNNRAEQFLRSIHAEGEARCAAIRAETDRQVADVLDAARADAQAKASRALQYEQDRAAAEANRAMSQARTDARAALADQRAALADQVFAETRQKLTDFTASAEYGPWLAQAAANLAARLGKGAVLYARSADLALLTGHTPAGCTLAADDSIQLGGLRGENGALAADDTLQTRLDAQRDWFVENAGLTIAL